MKRQVLIAFGSALLIGGGLGAACAVPQPPLECNFQNTSAAVPPYWAKYTLQTGSGTCSTYEGDYIGFQRYFPPGTEKPTFAVINRRLGRITRATFDGDWRFDPSDPGYQKELPRGTFEAVYPNADGFCLANSFVPADQNLPEVSVTTNLSDGGTQTTVTPATHVGEEWSNFRLLNNARFTSTLWTADVTVIRDSCTATYKLDAIWPPVGCEADADCNPLPDVAAGHVTGSGLQVDYSPKCSLFTDPEGYEALLLGTPGICMPTVSLDDLSKLD